LAGAIARAQAAGNEGLLELASFDVFPDGLLDEARKGFAVLQDFLGGLSEFGADAHGGESG
jgi:hypothetical protein